MQDAHYYYLAQKVVAHRTIEQGLDPVHCRVNNVRFLLHDYDDTDVRCVNVRFLLHDYDDTDVRSVVEN